eukprot:s514_g15.t1
MKQFFCQKPSEGFWDQTRSILSEGSLLRRAQLRLVSPATLGPEEFWELHRRLGECYTREIARWRRASGVPSIDHWANTSNSNTIYSYSSPTAERGRNVKVDSQMSLSLCPALPESTSAECPPGEPESMGTDASVSMAKDPQTQSFGSVSLPVAREHHPHAHWSKSGLLGPNLIQVGWVLKTERQWYPSCWHCGSEWLQQQAAQTNRNTQADWNKWQSRAHQARQQPRKPKRQVEYPPGLGWGGAQMTPTEYEEAVASLWQDADPQAQKVLRACGIEPPAAEETSDPRVTLNKYLASYKSITQVHRNLVARKVRLQEKADRIKTQFEKAIKDVAEVSKEIEKAEENLGKVQSQVQEQLKNVEPPEAHKVHDLQDLLKNAGVVLTDQQKIDLSAYLQTRQESLEEDSHAFGFGPEKHVADVLMIGEAGRAAFGPQRSRVHNRSNPLSRGEQPTEGREKGQDDLAEPRREGATGQDALGGHQRRTDHVFRAQVSFALV